MYEIPHHYSAHFFSGRYTLQPRNPHSLWQIIDTQNGNVLSKEDNL